MPPGNPQGYIEPEDPEEDPQAEEEARRRQEARLQRSKDVANAPVSQSSLLQGVVPNISDKPWTEKSNSEKAFWLARGYATPAEANALRSQGFIREDQQQALEQRRDQYRQAILPQSAFPSEQDRTEFRQDAAFMGGSSMSRMEQSGIQPSAQLDEEQMQMFQSMGYMPPEVQQAQQDALNAIRAEEEGLKAPEVQTGGGGPSTGLGVSPSLISEEGPNPVPSNAIGLDRYGRPVYTRSAEPGSGTAAQIMADVRRGIDTWVRSAQEHLSGDVSPLKEPLEGVEAPSAQAWGKFGAYAGAAVGTGLLAGLAVGTLPVTIPGVALGTSILAGVGLFSQQARIDKVVENVLAGRRPFEELPDAQESAEAQEGQVFTEGMQLAGNIFQRAENLPSAPLRKVSRIITLSLKGIGEAMGLPGIALKRTAGTVANIAQGYSPEEAYAASSIFWTQVFTGRTAKDYVDRYRAGEDAFLLQMELENPEIEMWGEIIADPLWFIGAKVGKMDDALQLATAGARNTVKAESATAAAIDAARGVAREGRSIDDLADVMKAGLDDVTSRATAAADNTQTIARQYGFTQPTARAKKGMVLPFMQDYLGRAMVASGGDAAKMDEILMDWVTLATPGMDEQLRTAALARMSQNDAAGVLLSDQGLYLGQMFGDMVIGAEGSYSGMKRARFQQLFQDVQDIMHTEIPKVAPQGYDELLSNIQKATTDLHQAAGDAPDVIRYIKNAVDNGVDADTFKANLDDSMRRGIQQVADARGVEFDDVIDTLQRGQRASDRMIADLLDSEFRTMDDFNESGIRMANLEIRAAEEAGDELGDAIRRGRELIDDPATAERWADSVEDALEGRKRSQQFREVLADVETPVERRAAAIEYMLDEISDPLERQLERTFPKITDRVKYQEQIAELQKQGKPLPRWLERFVGDEIPGTHHWIAQQQQWLQRKFYGPVVGALSDVWMGLSLPFGIRNFIVDSIVSAIDRPGALFYRPGTLNDFQRRVAGALGTKARFGFRGPATGAAGRAASRRSVTIFGKEIPLFGYSVAEGAERFHSQRVYGYGFKKTFENLWDTTRRSLRSTLDEAGMASEDIQRFENLVVKHDYDVDAAIKAWWGEDAADRRVLNVSRKQNRILNEFGQLGDELREARAAAESADDFARQADEIMERHRHYIDFSAKEEAIIPEDSPFWPEWEKITRDAGVHTSSWRGDLLARRVLQTQEARVSLINSFDDLGRKLSHWAGTKGDDAARLQNQIDEIITTAKREAQDFWAREGSLANDARAAVKDAADQAIREGDTALADRLWEEFLGHGGRRDRLHNRFREQYFGAFIDEGKGLDQLRDIHPEAAAIIDEFAPLQKAQQKVELSRLLDDADPDLFQLLGRIQIKMDGPVTDLMNKYGMMVTVESGVPRSWPSLAGELRKFTPPHISEFSVQELRAQDAMDASRMSELREVLEARAISPERGHLQQITRQEQRAAELVETLTMADPNVEITPQKLEQARSTAERQLIHEAIDQLDEAELLTPDLEAEVARVTAQDPNLDQAEAIRTARANLQGEYPLPRPGWDELETLENIEDARVRIIPPEGDEAATTLSVDEGSIRYIQDGDTITLTGVNAKTEHGGEVAFEHFLRQIEREGIHRFRVSPQQDEVKVLMEDMVSRRRYIEPVEDITVRGEPSHIFETRDTMAGRSRTRGELITRIREEVKMAIRQEDQKYVDLAQADTVEDLLDASDQIAPGYLEIGDIPEREFATARYNRSRMGELSFEGEELEYRPYTPGADPEQIEAGVYMKRGIEIRKQHSSRWDVLDPGTGNVLDSFETLGEASREIDKLGDITISPMAMENLNAEAMRGTLTHELGHEVMTRLLERGGHRLDQVRALMDDFGVSIDTQDGFLRADEIMADAVSEYVHNRSVFAKGKSRIAELNDLTTGQQKQLYAIVDEIYPSIDQEIIDFIDAMRGNAKTTFPMRPDDVPVNAQRPIHTTNAAGHFTEAGAAAENEAGLTSFVENLKDQVRSNWNRDEAVPARDPATEGALNQWAKQAKARLQENIAVSQDVAGQHRDFVLHDYSQRYGYDLALQMVYPYSFWYRNTYQKFLKRIITRPAVIGSYYDFRRYMDKKHADLPEWWRYNVTSNELLGVDWENPMYFNLESMMNPLHSITDSDFEDPAARQTWWGRTMADLGRFGPTPFLPFEMGVGILSNLTGHPEQGEAFLGSRLIPQTQTIKSATALLGAGFPGGPGTGVELDPMVWLQMGGEGTKWEVRRIGRAMGALVREGHISQAQAVDAAHAQSGPIWEMASRRAQLDRAPGNLLSGIFGVGAKGRTQSEIDIDRGFDAMHNLITGRSYMNENEYRTAWAEWEQQFPFMTAVLLSRKAGPANDQAYVWSVLSRIPPGQSFEYLDLVNLDDDLVDQFYADKGNMAGWEESDRKTMMGAMESLGAILEVPPNGTRREWEEARIQYSQMLDQVPEEIQHMTDVYYSKLSEDYDEGRRFLRQHPEVEQYLVYREQQVMQDPLLFRYYGGFDFIEKSWRRQMYTQAEGIFGENIQDVQGAFFDISDQGGDTRRFLANHPQLAGPYTAPDGTTYQNGYWGWLRKKKGEIGERLQEVSEHIPFEPNALVRPDANQDSIIAQNALAGMAERTPTMMDREVEIAPYLEAGARGEDDFSLSSWIDIQAEKQWPGIIEKDERYRELSATNPPAAQTFLAQNQDLQQFKVWERDIRSNYRRLQRQQRPQNPTQQAQQLTWGDWATALDPGGDRPYVPRLVVDYFRDGTLDGDLRDHLVAVWRQIGTPYGSFNTWLSAMEDSWKQQISGGSAPSQFEINPEPAE